MKDIKNIIKLIKEYYDDDAMKHIYSNAYSKEDFKNIVSNPDNKTYDLIKNRHEFDTAKNDNKVKEIDSKLKNIFPILNNFNFNNETIGTDLFLYYSFEKQVETKSYYIDITFTLKHNNRYDITLSFDYFNEDDDDYQSTALELEKMDTTFTNLDEKNLKTAIPVIIKKIKQFENMF